MNQSHRLALWVPVFLVALIATAMLLRFRAEPVDGAPVSTKVGTDSGEPGGPHPGELGEVRLSLVFHDGVTPVQGADVALFRLRRDDDGAPETDDEPLTLSTTSSPADVARFWAARNRRRHPMMTTSLYDFARNWSFHRRPEARRRAEGPQNRRKSEQLVSFEDRCGGRLATTDEAGRAVWKDVEPGPYRLVAVAGFRGAMEPPFEGAPIEVEPGRFIMDSRLGDSIQEEISGRFDVELGNVSDFVARSIPLTTVRGRVADLGGVKATVELRHHRSVDEMGTFTLPKAYSQWEQEIEDRFEFARVRAGMKSLKVRWRDSRRITYAFNEVFDAPEDVVVDLGVLEPKAGKPLVVRLVTDGCDVNPVTLRRIKAVVTLDGPLRDKADMDLQRSFQFVGLEPGDVALSLRLREGLVDRAGRPLRLVESRLEGRYPERSVFRFHLELVP